MHPKLLNPFDILVNNLLYKLVHCTSCPSTTVIEELLLQHALEGCFVGSSAYGAHKSPLIALEWWGDDFQGAPREFRFKPGRSDMAFHAFWMLSGIEGSL